ncbi:MAG TPA: VWA domain-containing protein [Gaiellaceae bacterium]|nr:VWA domain-containing protein [Gaiellaceae bacterium]
MRFESPLFLLALVVLAAAAALGWWLLRRRRMRYAVRFTNVEVLAAVAGGGAWRRFVPAALFIGALASLCVALARPHVERLIPVEKAMVILVIDTSRSMQAKDVKPTRLAAAQEAMRRFLDRVPDKVRVGLVVFAGDAQIGAPPTTDHGLVEESIDEIGQFHTFGGTAIGDALAAAVELAQDALNEGNETIALRAAPAPGTKGLASILFLSDGAQTRGTLLPYEGAERAKAAGIPVYTVALGTPEGVVSGRFGFGFGGPPSGPPDLNGQQTIPVPPDPATLREIAETTGGKFTEARTADVLEETYENLGSSLAREPGETEITFAFLGIAGALLLLAGLLSALWSPRFP